MRDTEFVFFDSNIWLYGFGANVSDKKHRIADELIASYTNVRVSSQVIGEVCNTLLTKTHTTESRVRELIYQFYNRYHPVHIFGLTPMVEASSLRERYNFSHWDSFIVLAALESNCSILYSEDMQDSLVIEGTLTIRNPFKEI